MDKIAVLDFGGQYAHLITNRLRRLGVYSEIKSSTTPVFYLKNYKGLILSGGPASVYDRQAPRCDRRLFHLSIPVLGICYGHQLMSKLLGGEVRAGKIREYGPAELTIKKPDGLFIDLEDHERVWMSHGDTVSKLPIGFEVIGETKDCPTAAIADLRRRLFGIQFHAEVTHTPCGSKILENFISICQAKKEWSMDDFITNKIDSIRRYVRDRNVFMLLSGGVDSTVAYILLEKALGPNRVYGVFIDTGFLRWHEGQAVMQALHKMGIKNCQMYEAGSDFLSALKDVYDPEVKRMVIGNKFMEVQQKISRDLKLNPYQWLLGQGTIYPDTIESGGTKHAARIKTHHNRVPAMEELIRRRRVIEPVRELYKDEMRELGEKLGLSSEFVWRHPFPGPGLAVRILCTKQATFPANHLALERQINMILGDTDGLSGKLLPIKSVGVQGDARTYRHPLLLLGDTTWEELGRVSTQLTNQFMEINRVVYGFGLREVNDLAIKPSDLTKERIALLQKVDSLVTKMLFEKNIYRDIWQFPVVLLPLVFNKQGEETVVLRPVRSEEAMTAEFYQLDMLILKELVDEIMNIPQVSAVLYDITNKPPGTIEWE